MCKVLNVTKSHVTKYKIGRGQKTVRIGAEKRANWRAQIWWTREKAVPSQCQKGNTGKPCTSLRFKV